MIEKGRLTAMQMGMLMFPTILATAILILPAITVKYAKQDAWLSPLWACAVGFVLVYAMYKLHTLYPGKSIVEASELIIGKWLGKCFGFVVFFLYLQDTGFVIREYEEFVVGNFLQRTPAIVVTSCMVFVCAIAVRSGAEVLGRCAQVFVPLIIIFLLLILMLLIPELKFIRLLPVLGGGLGPSVRGAVPQISWFSDFMLITFFLPVLADQRKGLKHGLLSVAVVAVTMVLINMVILLLFGHLASKYTYPVMVASRYISLADFIEHTEAMVMAIWVMGVFVKICVYYYCLLLIFSQWLNFSDYRRIVYPVGFLLVPFSSWVTPNVQVMSDFFDKVGAAYYITLKIVLPMLLTFIALIRKKIAPAGS
ncbi:endospore germination permease [Paenibacillus doosanensis]|uniref:GerAB/ArcD/ProY family transporter n=1 Tax=Paenibacillus doosanensis TaxID=1229154 RepID=UPI0021800285|nr:endospore germination permease [Paenibacillus doosanensis]MCS7458972.1 endospore germination permease [Paenibacillus doosanensis]